MKLIRSVRGVALACLALTLVACGSSGGGGGGDDQDTAGNGLAALPSFSVVSANQSNLLRWPEVPNATAYHVYWATSSGVTKTSGTKIANVTSPYTHSGLTNGVTYYYLVTYETAAGESEASTALSMAPRLSSASIPQPVAAFGANGQAEVRWNGVTGATAYHLYYGGATGVSTASTKVHDVTSPAVITGLSNNSPVYFVVTAETGSGESLVSAEAATIPYLAEPLRPTVIAVTPGVGEVDMSWDAAHGATSYEVYWSTSSGVTTDSTKVEVNDTSWTHTGLSNGIRYFYAVRAKNAQGSSALSREFAAQPGTQLQLTAQTGNTENTLTWPDVGGATSYTLYWDAGATTQTISNVTSPYTHVGLTPGTMVTYQLTATVGGTEGAKSNEVRVTPYGAAPEPPRRLVARAGHGQISVEVAPNTPALRYNIYWNTGGDVTTSDSVIANVTLPYTHTGLTNGTAYYYRIAALNTEGTSELSPENLAEPDATQISSVIGGVTDTILRNCINSAANAYGWVHVHQVIYVDCDNPAGVAATGLDLTGLDQFPNIWEMYINRRGTIANPGVLANLHNLTWIELSGTSVSDLSVFATHFNLVYLVANDNGIATLAPLQNLAALEQLSLRDNAFSDLAPLANLDNLTDLWLGMDESAHGTISDLSPLSNLTSLVDLRVDHHLVNTLDDIAGLINLQVLRLDHDTADSDMITDLAPLENLTALTELSLNFNDLAESELGHLVGLVQLQTLGLAGNLVFNTDHLTTLPNLVSLDLRGNTLQDIHLPGIGQLTGLQTLDLSDNPSLTNLSGLSALVNLRTFIAKSNGFVSVAPLTGMTQMRILDLSGNAVVDASPLQSLTQLTWVNLGNNALGNLDDGKVETLSTLTNAEFIWLYGNTGMSCFAAGSLITALGENDDGYNVVQLDSDKTTDDTATNGVNCTNP